METTIDKPATKTRRLGVGQLIAFGVVVGVTALFAMGMQALSAKPVDKGMAPQFTLPALSGGTFSLAEQRGKVVVVNFWASWCVPCRQQAPVLETTWRKYKDRGVVFVGVDYVDTDKEAQVYLQEFGVTYPNGPDIGTETARRYHVQGVPETYFVGKDGRLSGNHIGPIDEVTLTAKIESLLGTPAKGRLCLKTT